MKSSSARRTASALAGICLLTLGCQRTPATLVGFAGGPSGGSFFPAAGAISTFSQQQIPNVTVSVEGTGGSGENVRLVGSGDGNMGIAYGGDLHQGFFGEEDFKGAAQTNLRAVGLLFWGYSHVVVLKEVGHRAVADLANKRIAIGGTGSGSALTGERIFRHFELLDKMKVIVPRRKRRVGGAQGRPGRRYHWQSGAPNAAVLDTVATHSIAVSGPRGTSQDDRLRGSLPLLSGR